MGFYIHDCVKMRYKVRVDYFAALTLQAEYAPSELLDPSLQVFVPFDHCKPLLDVSRRTTFAHSDDAAMATDDEDANGPAPGFLDANALPASLVASAVVLEKNTLVPATKSRAWQNGRRSRELRELLAALGPDVLGAGVVAYVP